MLKTERTSYILEQLQWKPTVKVMELSSELGVTPETIRRDLEYLEKEEQVDRVHGGAVLKKKYIAETSSEIRSSINKREKEDIARFAVLLLKPGDSVALDVSTTNTEIARQIAATCSNITVLTNSLEIASILSTNHSITIYLPPGRLRNMEQCILGTSAVDYINQFHLSVCFMSVSGISLDAGFTDYGEGEMSIKKAMFNHSIKKYVVADHTKFEQASLLKVCALEDVDAIITDRWVDEKTVQRYEANDVVILRNTDN